ncbi:MAG: phosphoglucosamine mutase [Dongiaceae bacterium]
MTRRLFGTDGIRGTANREPVTAATMLRLAMAAGAHFTRGDHRHRVVIGKDTRLSGYMLEPALTAGFIAMGMDVILLSPLPTPAVAMLTRSLRADLGVMISASHNPYEDNGIKLFGPDGYKLSDAAEMAIEKRMDDEGALVPAKPDALGRAQRLDDARGRYTEFVKNSVAKGLSLDGLKIVVDCANGAAYKVAPTVLWELGAEVVPMAVSPDGFNINRDCGATSTDAVARRVVEEGADLGIALDGDADRVILIDEKGAPIDGDQVLAVIAGAWAKAGRIKGDRIVATAMSNFGLEQYLAKIGLQLERVAVGDRYVVERMREGGFNLGGEQSGHVVFGDYGTTGDGLMAALQVLAVTVPMREPASIACRRFKAMPQRLENVRVNGSDVLTQPPVQRAIRDGEAALGGRGRILVRKSGTEPVVRVMVEGEDEVLIGKVVDAVAAEIRAAGGGA